MITPTFVWVKWDAVSGSTGYDIVRDGTKVSATRTATAAKLGILPGGHDWIVRAKPSGAEQALSMRLEDPSPAPQPPPAPRLSARSSIQANDPLRAGSTVDWSLTVTQPVSGADSCRFFVNGVLVEESVGVAQVFHHQLLVAPGDSTVGFEVRLGAQSAGVPAFPIRVV